MAGLVLGVAVFLLVLGVIATVVPVVPGAVFSLAGLVFYRWMSGEPGILVFGVLLLLSLTAVLLDYLATVFSARAGGASWHTATVAVLAGVVFAFVLGPVGFIGGTAGFVFVIEVSRGKGIRDAWEAAKYTTVGVAVSAYLRVVLNIVVLVVFVLVVVR